MSIIEPVDPYRCYRHMPEPNAVFRPDGASADARSLREFYNEEDNKAVMKQLRDLIRGSHQVGVLLGQRHFAPSPSWRDEYLMDHGHGHLSRFAVRVHLYEELGGNVAGRYLGFVSLRPPGSRLQRKAEQPDKQAGSTDDGTSYERTFTHGTEGDHAVDDYFWIIDAELGCPPHMQRPRYHVISTTASSARLGVLPFRSSVFMQPDYDTRGSSCTHVALSEALHLVMGRFGCRPISQREFDMLLWMNSKGNQPFQKPFQEISLKGEGARLPAALEVVRQECNGGGFLDTFPATDINRDMRVMETAHRCLTDTLANGLPVVLHVHAGVLANGLDELPHRKPGEMTPDERKTERAEYEEMAHAILIFGMRLISAQDETLTNPVLAREDAMELPGRLVGHDTFHGPYAEWSTRRILEAALAAYPEGDENRGIHMLALGPRTVKLSMDSVRYQAGAHMAMLKPEWCHPYMKAADIPLNPVPDREEWRYVVRLQSLSEIHRRYQPVPAPGETPLPMYQPAENPASRICCKTKEDLESLKDDLLCLSIGEMNAHFWCVEVLWAAPPTDEDRDAVRKVRAMPVNVLFLHSGVETDRPDMPFALLRWKDHALVREEPSALAKARKPWRQQQPPEGENFLVQPKNQETTQVDVPHGTHARFPEVSLITSWHMPPPRSDSERPNPPQERAAKTVDQTLARVGNTLATLLRKNSVLKTLHEDGTLEALRKSSTLEALRIALEQQVGVLDLYFLDDSDVPWYWHMANRPRPSRGKYPDALRFAATLRPREVQHIAAALSCFLADHYDGRLVGPRPRFAALATYWPHLSLPREWNPKDKRPKRSVRAVRNAILLASHLGCNHVEIVGGSALPEIQPDTAPLPDSQGVRQPAELQSALTDSKTARYMRRDALVKHLCEVYTRVKRTSAGLVYSEQPCFEGLTSTGKDWVPKVCLEVEPGKAFLINQVSEYVRVYGELLQICKHTASHVLLNVDIAHMMLCEGDADNGRSGADCQIEVIRGQDRTGYDDLIHVQGIEDRIGHMHVSDHARTHASDLTPGTYHFFHQFLPWLKLAVELTAKRDTNFSGVIAVEMESCADIHEAARSIGRIRRWLQAAPGFELKPALVRLGSRDEGETPSDDGSGTNHPTPPHPGKDGGGTRDGKVDGHDDSTTSPQESSSTDTPLQRREDPVPPDVRMIQAALVVVDIGNSTRWALTSDSMIEAVQQELNVALNIDSMVSELCTGINRYRGSVLSFTGDGIVAVFDQRHFRSKAACALEALRAAHQMAEDLLAKIQKNPDDPRTIRIALHWGNVYLPTVGTLRYQAIGRDVIIACRLCGWVKGELEGKAHPYPGTLASQAGAPVKVPPSPSSTAATPLPVKAGGIRAHLASTKAYLDALGPDGPMHSLGSVFEKGGRFAPDGFAPETLRQYQHLLEPYAVNWEKLVEFLSRLD